MYAPSQLVYADAAEVPAERPDVLIIPTGEFPITFHLGLQALDLLLELEEPPKKRHKARS
jgi:hypothetical protein